jgi:hypothetical protein
VNDHALLELRLVRAALLEVLEVQQDLQRRLLDREDRRTGVVLLPLALELIGSRPFDAAGLAVAALNDRTSAGRAACEIVSDYTDDDGGFRGLARLLQRLQGVRLAGCKLVPAGEGRGGLRWRLQVSGE